jgi:hypothetical protein
VKEKPVRLWDLSGLIYREATLRSLLTAAGGNPGPLRERLGKNPGYVRHQSLRIQIIAAAYVLSMMILPILAVVKLRSGSTHEWNLLVSSVSAATFFLIQFGYILMLTVLAVSELLDDDLYAWPQTLPVSTGGIARLRLFSLLRGLFLPVCGVAVAYPLALGISSRSWAVAGIAVVTSAAHLPLTLALVVLTGLWLHRTLRGQGGTSRGAQTARVITMLAYGLGTLLVVFVMQVAINFLSRLFDAPRLAAAVSRTIILALSWAPLPTAPASLTMLLAARAAGLGVDVPILPAALGSLGYFVVVVLLIVAALRILGRSGAATVAVGSGRASVPAPTLVRLRLTTPSRAFLRQLWLGATRETQVLMFLLFPLVLPILSIVGPKISGAPSPFVIYFGAGTASIFSTLMLVRGLSRQQAGAGQLVASLPVRERDRVFPRFVLAPLLASGGALIADLLFLRGKDLVTGLVLALVPAVTAPAGLLIKMLLFGRLKNRVVLDEVYPDHATRKWIIVLTAMAGIAAVLMALERILVVVTSPIMGNLIFVAVVLASLGGLSLLSRRLFP